MIAKYYIEGEASFPYSTPDSPSEPSPATDHLHGFEALNRDSDCDKDNDDNDDDEDGVDDREGEGRDDVSDVDGKADNDNGDVRDHSIVENTEKEIEVSNSNQISLAPSSALTSNPTSTSAYKEHVYTSLPIEISSRYPSTPHPIGVYTKKAEDISSSDLQSLLLPLNVLSACWAARRLSIVGKHDRRSYCFTHSYGRLYDKSSGSVLWEVSVHSFILSFCHLFCSCLFSCHRNFLFNFSEFISHYLPFHVFILSAPRCFFFI